MSSVLHHESRDGPEAGKGGRVWRVIVDVETLAGIADAFTHGDVAAVDAFTHGDVAASTTQAVATTPNRPGPDGWRQRGVCRCLKALTSGLCSCSVALLSALLPLTERSGDRDSPPQLAFRLLARRHGAQLCYTPMIRCEDFSTSGAGINLLERHVDDCPLVAHFSGNDPQRLLEVARQAERCTGVVAVDLNLGCPQRTAKSGHFGAFLCDAADRTLLLNIVATLSRSLSVPFFCKIRLLDELDDTLAFVQQLEDAGCALLAVHGRYRGSPMHRRDGPAHLDQIALIKKQLTIPVITNGNVRDAAELVESLVVTGADGVMSAEGALENSGDQVPKFTVYLIKVLLIHCILYKKNIIMKEKLRK